MSPVTQNFPRLLVLPEGCSPEARICTLAHPRTSTPSQYYFDPVKGVYEFTRIAAPKSVVRSWLIAGRVRNSKANNEAVDTEKPEYTKETHASAVPQAPEVMDTNPVPISNGYVIKDAELLVATPIDYLFLLLPAFANKPSAKSQSSKGLFLSSEDLLEKISDGSKDFGYIINLEPIRQAMEERMRVMCDTVDAGDEKMYRLNIDKLMSELLLKTKHMIAEGLPKSMEDRFVRKILETPVMVIKREESSISETNLSQNQTPVSESTSLDTVDSQTSLASGESAATAVSVNTEVTIPEDVKPVRDNSEIYHLLRLRTALSYMISAYVPPTLAATLNTLLASEASPINFKALDERLADLAKMRAEALAARSLGDFSRKRSMYEEDDAAESRAEKKRRKEEEEKKKKAGENRSIRDLKKVDTKGMRKMSDFFGKGAAAKKK